MKPNRLAKEKSPYLLQHANNPVDWFPWSDDAFQKAASENKPIFLSIGYSTCHWCHVMEKESFEDKAVAELLNNSFVSIKVDREERPDIDHIYMKVCQLITGNGGWPLSVFLTPEKKPFFAGTYFPKESKYGRIGLIDLLKRINNLWDNNKPDLLSSADNITQHLVDSPADNSPLTIDKEIFHNAFNNFQKLFDQVNGGFGSAPKFPSPHNLMFLLRYWKIYKNPLALEMVVKTLTNMRLGGIYDHLGFGFHRYSTDDKWFAPHFEKMLYDQALLIIVYSEAFQAAKKEEFKQTVFEIIEYLQTNMISPEGGFYSAQDADSEGIEGKYYVWSLNEINNILGKDEAAVFANIYNISEPGNYNESGGGLGNNNIPFLKAPLEDLSAQNEIYKNELITKLKRSRIRLLNERNKRIPPLLDNKILTDWNGLIITALSIAGRVFDNIEYITLAEKCKSFLLGKMKGANGHLLHRFCEREAGINANLDDYAFLIWSAIELYRSDFNEQHLVDAINLTDTAIKLFWDNNGSGFYFSNNSNNDLIVRIKEFYDGAIPSGNSVMLNNLIFLSRITADSRYGICIDKLVSVYSQQLSNSHASHSFALTALLLLLEDSYELIICGEKNKKEQDVVMKQINSIFAPELITIIKKENDSSVLEYLNNYVRIGDKITYFLCENHVCNLPSTDINQIINFFR